MRSGSNKVVDTGTMDVLIGCEFSGIVRDAFSRRGHNAWSCDLRPSMRPGQHHQCDLLGLLAHTRWDLLIVHPPCTHLAVSGARHFPAKRADGRQQAALNFVAQLFEYGKRARGFVLENPVSIISTMFRKADQTIQPWQFGHAERKATCLWFDGYVQPLRPTTDLRIEMMAKPARERDRIHHMPPGPMREMLRSQSYQGIAEAMAQQWG